MYLFINNIGLNKIVLGIGQSKKPFEFLNLLNSRNKNDRILPGIDRLLKKNKKKLNSLKGIIVVNGPGSFAGIRVGLSVANTLAWVLDIPVIGINLLQGKDSQELVKIGIEKLSKIKNKKQVMPFYGKEPNITKAKQDY